MPPICGLMWFFQKALRGFEGGRSEFYSGVVLHPHLQPATYRVGLGPSVVDADVFLDGFFQFSFTSACVLPRTFLMMALPVSGSWPTVYLPSHRPSFRFRMFPSPFARLFGMVSAPFATNNTVIRGTKLPENRTVIRKLSFAPRSHAALSLTIAAQFLRCRRGTLLWLQRCGFGTAENPFLLTTAAQNMHVLLRKMPPCRNHFFGWLKMGLSSTACGMVTLKSPLSRAFSVPHVHPRLRKCSPRCTLDCGFQTPESPALRGCVGGPRALATAALYLC